MLRALVRILSTAIIDREKFSYGFDPDACASRARATCSQ
jgi:hypothetical protein